MDVPAPHPSEAPREPEQAERLGNLLARIQEVCPLHESAQRVMQASRDPNASVPGIVDELVKDAAIAAEVLRAANSPIYGQPHQVSDLGRAVMVIGLAELHDLAAALSMLAAFEVDESLARQVRSVSVLTATLSSHLASELGAGSRSHAYLAGLLSEIGALACMAVDHATYASLWERADGDPEALAELEQQTYGETSGFIGAALLERNGLPAPVVQAVLGSPLSPVDGLEPLDRAVLFAKLAAPRLVHAAREGEGAVVTDELPGLASRLGLAVPPDRLVPLCVGAAEAAELGLRGLASLGQAACDPPAPDEPAAAPTAPPESPAQRPRFFRWPWSR